MFAIAKFRDTRTIVTHPASTTHSKLSVDERLAVSITDGLVFLGLETVKDVIADLEQAVIDFRFGINDFTL
jgi:O-succinylhomoserine sulfhydrylase